jgi:hypothetical protein
LGLLTGSLALTKDAVPYGLFDTVTFPSSETPKTVCCVAHPAPSTSQSTIGLMSSGAVLRQRFEVPDRPTGR